MGALMGDRRAVLILLMILCSLLVSILDVKIVQAESTIVRIREDGTVEGTDKIQRNGDLYTLTDDLTCSVTKDDAFLFIETHNIVIDGAGHTIKGTGNGTAIEMLRRQNVTVKNCNFEGFNNAFHFWVVSNTPVDSKYWGLPPATNNKILNNNITVTGKVEGPHEAIGWAIFLRFEAENNLISGNTIMCQDPNGGISDTGYNNTFIDNRFVGCGLHLSSSSQSSGFNNTIDGAPCWYLNGVSNQVIDGAGQVFLFNCKNMTITNVQPPNGEIPAVQLSNTTDSKVSKCEGAITLIGSNNNYIYENSPKVITLSRSNYNKVYANTIMDSGVCIELYGSSNYNEVYGNILLNSSTSSDADSRHYSGKNAVGIQLGESQLGGCEYNIVYGNNIVNHDVGIECYGGSNNIIYVNNIADSNVGIALHYSDNNRVYQNNITRCGYAVIIRSSNNTFYGNNFVENSNQISISHQTLFSSDIITAYSTNNTFDSGHILGGNFWSNYNGTDDDGDGIGDIPYIINEDNQDNYPLMEPISLESIPQTPNDSSSLFEERTFQVHDTHAFYYVKIFSNSTISDFYFHYDLMRISFYVNGTSGITGLCNVTIPSEFMSTEFSIFKDEKPLIKNKDYTENFNGTHYLFTITYEHSTHLIEIFANNNIPEFPSWVILPLFLTATLIGFLVRKRLVRTRTFP